MKHLHHIVPKHVGGTDDPSNLKELTISEHAEAHRLLWETYGRIEDRLAWHGLAGMIGKEEIIETLIKQPKTQEMKNRVRASLLGRKHSESAKEKMRQKKLGKSFHPWKGLKLKTAMFSAEYENMVEYSKRGGYHAGPTSFLGKHHTDESKKKISLAKTKKQ